MGFNGAGQLTLNLKVEHSFALCMKGTIRTHYWTWGTPNHPMTWGNPSTPTTPTLGLGLGGVGWPKFSFFYTLIFTQNFDHFKSVLNCSTTRVLSISILYESLRG